MRNLFIFLFLCNMLSLWGLTWVSGIVIDESGKPLADVWINTTGDDAITGANGHFRVMVTLENKGMEFRKIGYKTLTICPVTHSSYQVTLLKDPVPLSGISVEGEYNRSNLPRTADKQEISIPPNYADILADRLLRQANVLVQGPRLSGERQTLSLLGFRSRHILVSWDGVPLNTFGEDFDLSSIPTGLIDNIEIIRNNASGLAGSGAMGGIVNLQSPTLTAERKADVTGGFGTGSYGLIRSSLGYSLNQGSWESRVFVNHYRTENNYRFQYNQENGTTMWTTRANNAKEAQEIYLQYAFRLKDWLFSHRITSQDFRKELPGPTNFLLLYDQARMTGQVLRHHVEIQHLKGKYGQDFTFYRHIDQTHYNNLHSSLPAYAVERTNRIEKTGGKLLCSRTDEYSELSLLGEYRQEGYEYQEAPFVSHAIPLRTQTLRSAALAYDRRFDAGLFTYETNFNTRLDQLSHFDAFGTYRLGASATYNGNVTFMLGATQGTGFTVPSFYSLYWKGDASAIGNPDLQPERSHGWQIYSQSDWLGQTLRYEYHQSSLKNMISWLQSNQWGLVWKPVNIEKSELISHSVTLTLKPVSHLTWETASVWTDGINKTRMNGTTEAFLNKKIPYQPERQFRSSLTYERSLWQGGLFYNYTGRQWLTPDNLLAPMPGVGLWDASLGSKINHGAWQFSPQFDIHNLTDKRYESYPYMPQPGRNWQLYISIQYQII